MNGLGHVVEAEDLGQHGGWRFTRERVVDEELTTVFHRLYEVAFGPLRTRAMARQVLTQEEFRRQMEDGDVVKYVAWTREGQPVGMCALTNVLSTIPWISPEYFAARFPEHWSRGAVWYFSFLLAHPSQRHTRFFDQLIQVGVGELIEQRAICAYDMCGYNDDELGLGRRVIESVRRSVGVTPHRADVQNYYALDLGGAAASEPSSVPLSTPITPRTAGTL